MQVWLQSLDAQGLGVSTGQAECHGDVSYHTIASNGGACTQ